jgi:hypothetical protein
VCKYVKLWLEEEDTCVVRRRIHVKLWLCETLEVEEEDTCVVRRRIHVKLWLCETLEVEAASSMGYTHTHSHTHTHTLTHTPGSRLRRLR